MLTRRAVVAPALALSMSLGAVVAAHAEDVKKPAQLAAMRGGGDGSWTEAIPINGLNHYLLSINNRIYVLKFDPNGPQGQRISWIESIPIPPQ